MIVARPMLRSANVEQVGIGGTAAECEIDVPEEQLPCVTLGLISKGILPAAIRVAVVIVEEMFRDVDFEPFFDID